MIPKPKGSSVAAKLTYTQLIKYNKKVFRCTVRFLTYQKSPDIILCRPLKMSNVAKSRESANYELSLPWVPLDASSHFEKSGSIRLKQLIYKAYSFRI